MLIRGRTLQVPILQGGMGVGVSLGGLAGAVAAQGALGCISTADAGFREPDFEKDPNGANLRALTKEIEKARQIARGKGMVVEGCEAGGHLGFDEQELLKGQCPDLEQILPEVLAEVKKFEEQFGHTIPVFVAGGVYTGQDMARFTRLGAAGVQMATRFIPTWECDASQAYKDVLLQAKAEDVRIIHSPVGMPGRALATPLVQRLEQGGRVPPRRCARCLKSCDPGKVPYCITRALIRAVQGDVENGLFFCGSNVGRLDKMRSVKELIDEVMTEWRMQQ